MFFDLEDQTPFTGSDNLQPYTPLSDEPAVEGNWFHQGVRRVRRELNRLFGGNDVHHRQKRAKKPALKKRATLTKRQQRPVSPRKRASDDYENEVGSGNDGLETVLCESQSNSTTANLSPTAIVIYAHFRPHTIHRQ